ncbi:MAG: hypothetical protein KatS3mg039_0636 [Candidatus Kapaibacterium sp.]|nr:MAG: hypothetical protein KatS3mg039_0636 [Candidatus Kapabacteria bacterium]
MSKRTKSKSPDRQLDQAVKLPLRLVFNLSTLAAALSMLLAIAVGETELYRILLRAMLVFMGVAVAGSIIMAVGISIIHRIKQEELNEKLRLAEEEKLAASLTLPTATPPAAVAPNDVEVHSG